MRILLCADLHLRDSNPVSRKDNFYETLKRKIAFIQSIPCDYKLCAGDVFHKWNSTIATVDLAMELTEIETIYGNHDIPTNNMKLKDTTALGFVAKHNNEFRVHDSLVKQVTIDGCKIHIEHTMIWQGTLPFPGCLSPSVEAYMDGLNAELLLTGDNHQTFTCRKDGKLLVNPGSLSRMTKDQKDHKPCVFVYDTATKDLTQHFIPIEDDVWKETAEDLYDGEEFIKIMNETEQMFREELSFSKNLSAMVATVKPTMKSMFSKAMEAIRK